MRSRSWMALLAVSITASCAGDDRTPGEMAADQCRSQGGVPRGSSPEDLVCLAAAPTGTQSFGDVALDTDQSPLCGAPMQGPAGCVVAAASITITGRLRATGSRPLVLVADTITVTATGAIDIAAHSGDGARAAGADPASCAQFVPSSAGPAHCGAGGSFGGVGGNNTSAEPCAPAPAVVPTEVRGGCSGRKGANISAPGGTGGGAGGGVLLIASSVTLDGTINASGAGGGGAGAASIHGGSEGGGGGSGGMIAIDAAAISGTGVVMANGGGGGAGDGQFMLASSPGSDPDEAAPTAAATGGRGPAIADFPDGVASGGAGGAAHTVDGTSGDRAPMQPVLADLSVGGGGGSAGVIRFYAARFTTGTVSPDA